MTAGEEFIGMEIAKSQANVFNDQKQRGQGDGSIVCIGHIRGKGATRKLRTAGNRLELKILLIVPAMLSIAGCAHNPPRVFGLPESSLQPETPWNPPKQAIERAMAFERDTGKAGIEGIPRGALDHLQSLSLSDIVDIALRNSDQTRQAWAQARAAAATYGGKRGSYFPSIAGSLSADKQKGVSPGGKTSFKSTSYSAGAALNWLVLDWGGRTASVDETRLALFAANWTHAASIQNVILEAEQAFYDYYTAKVLFEAQQAAVDEARTNLDAARERERAGLATIADVLQARTAHSQALLSLALLKGRTMTVRGALATAMGLPANTSFEAEIPISAPPLDAVKKSIAECLDTAVLDRPDLAAVRAQALQAQAHVRTIRSQGLPSLSANGNAGEVYFTDFTKGNTTYGISATLNVPIFSGFSHRYDVLTARAQADAALSGERNYRDLVALQVWTDYYNLETAASAVRTSEDLMASATKNQEVAAGRYKAGVGSIIDLLTAQSGLESARAQQIQARASWWTAAAQLAHATGRLRSGAAAPDTTIPETGERKERRP
jgi:outer membrane protein